MPHTHTHTHTHTLPSPECSQQTTNAKKEKNVRQPMVGPLSPSRPASSAMPDHQTLYNIRAVFYALILKFVMNKNLASTSTRNTRNTDPPTHPPHTHHHHYHTHHVRYGERKRRDGTSLPRFRGNSMNVNSDHSPLNKLVRQKSLPQR